MRNTRFIRFIGTIAVLALFSGLARAGADREGPQSPVARDIVRTIDAHFQEREREGFSGVVLLATDDQVVLEKAYGHRDPRTKAPMRTSDVFDIGSLVKPITRAAILKLEAEGQLSTADPISKYFPDVPKDKRAITIDHVLHHRAGFPDTFGSDYELVLKDALRMRLFESPLIAPVGKESNYSNAGYSLLAMLIEQVSGKPYEEYVHEALLAPAGHPRIGYTIPSWPADTLAVGIGPQGRCFGTPLQHPWFGDGPSWNLRGNGGMLADARSLYTFFIMLEQNSEVLPSAAREKWKPSVNPEGRQAYMSAGGNGIFNSLVVRDLTNDLTLVAMSNLGSEPIEQEKSLTIVRQVLQTWAEAKAR